MAEATETIHALKTESDGTVKLAIEKYNELLERIADQKDSIGRLNDLLTKARNEPPVINRTVVQKTDEMAAQDHRMWGGTLMGLGMSMFAIGAIRFRLGRAGS